MAKRIMIIGSSGSGKTTLARKISKMRGLPIVHLDAQFWNKGWQPTPGELWRAKQHSLAAASRWIMDGNYDGSMEIRLDRADAVIFLDFKRFVCLLGVVKRWIKTKGKTRPDMAAGCPEKLDLPFLKYVWNFQKESRPNIIKKLSKFDGKVIVLKSHKDIERFLILLR